MLQEVKLDRFACLCEALLLPMHKLHADDGFQVPADLPALRHDQHHDHK